MDYNQTKGKITLTLDKKSYNVLLLALADAYRYNKAREDEEAAQDIFEVWGKALLERKENGR